MTPITDSVHMDVSQEEVWEWLEALADHYTDWHPGHVSAEWSGGRPNEVGSIMTAVEWLGGHRETLRFQLTGVEPPCFYGYRILGAISLILPRGSFTIRPESPGAHFTATLYCRALPVVEALASSRIRALRAHMHEEGRNLKRILEATAGNSSS